MRFATPSSLWTCTTYSLLLAPCSLLLASLPEHTQSFQSIGCRFPQLRNSQPPEASLCLAKLGRACEMPPESRPPAALGQNPVRSARELRPASDMASASPGKPEPRLELAGVLL